MQGLENDNSWPELTRFSTQPLWMYKNKRNINTDQTYLEKRILLSARTQHSWRTRIWKNINTISMHGEKFTQLHAAQRKLLRPLNNLENGSFSNRENLQYKKTADSALLSLFMRTNGKCNNSHAPSTGLSGILPSVRTQYFWRTRIWKIINTISMYGEKFYQLHAAQRQLLRLLEKRILQKKRAYNISKQQTRFYWKTAFKRFFWIQKTKSS